MISVFAMLLMLLGGGSNDLLDLIHTESYWKAKGVTVSVEQLIADTGPGAANLQPNPAGNDLDHRQADPPHAADIRRLMAIRTLGEMKKAQAVPALKALEASKEPFVADYARTAIAAIAGKPINRAAPSAQERMIDVGLLPAESDLVAQLASMGKGAVGGDIFGDAPLPPEIKKEEMLRQMTGQALVLAEQIGNVRVNALTAGLYANVPNQPGYAVIVARGQYDSKAIAAMLAATGAQTTHVNGMDVFQIEQRAAILFPSDTRAVLVTCDAAGKMPLEAVVAAIKKDVGALHENTEMMKQIGALDTTQTAWGVVKITDGIRQIVPPTAPFDLATLVISHKDDSVAFALKAQGSDPEKVKTAVEDAKSHLQEAIGELRTAVTNTPAAKPVLDLLESIQVTDDAGKATADGSIKGPLSLPLLFFGVRQDVRSVPAGSQPGKPGGL